MEIDIFDEFGIGGGASAVAGGLLHPYSPKLKPLWKADHFWEECLHLLSVAEQASSSSSSLVTRRGILRPALNPNHLDVMRQNSKHCLPTCPIHEIAATRLIPNLSTPFDTAFFMPLALNINPQSYLQALYLACLRVVDSTSSSSGCHVKHISLQERFVESLRQLEDEYDIVVVCLGARADMLLEISGVLPLRSCRGVVAHLQLCDVSGGDFPDHSPSVLSDAWMAIKGPRSLYLGSTWEWGSRDYSPHVSSEEASITMQALLPKASGIYPQITSWSLSGARAGLRAMPSRTPQGSFPLLGCIDDIIGRPFGSKHWIIGGLGSRGLLYHAWLGKLTAQAVLSGDEALIPRELTSWKKMKTNGTDIG